MNMSKKESTLKIEFPGQEEIAQILYGEDSTWIYTRDNAFDNAPRAQRPFAKSKRRKLNDISTKISDLDQQIDKLTTQSNELITQKKELQQKRRKLLHESYDVVYRIRRESHPIQCSTGSGNQNITYKTVGAFSSYEKAKSMISEKESKYYDDYIDDWRKCTYSIIVEDSKEDDMDKLDKHPPFDF